jgi:hypothetical protein
MEGTMSVATFKEVTKYVTFDEHVGKLEFDHLEEGKAFMEIVELFKVAFAMHADDEIPPNMRHYADWVENLSMTTEPDSVDVVSFRCCRLNKIHDGVFERHNELIERAIWDIDGVREFGPRRFVFDCVDPSER